MSTRSNGRRRRRLPSRSNGGFSRPPKSEEIELHFDLTDTVDRFVSAVENGEADEIALYGTRGDGKTQGALIAQVLHAVKHGEKGFDLPTIWMGVTDTFESHKQKTIPSLEELHWEGRWRLSEQNHLAVFSVERKELVHLSLFGIEDQGATDRVRRAAHGMWFEEAAPTSVMVQSGGVSELAWGTGLTSLRLPSYSNPAILTENYPDEDHWTWRHFSPGDGVAGVHPEYPRRMWFRVPPGERASEEQRRKWMEALKDRPDILRRLLAGQPGTVQLGPQVAVGFQEDLHMAKERIRPMKGEPLVIGQDGGHTPTTVIGQPWRGFIRIYACLTIERGGMKQHVEQNVRPWLSLHAPWALQDRSMIVGVYDPSMADEETDIERNPLDVLEKLLRGYWQPGPSSWEARKNLLLPSLNAHAGPGQPALQIDPVDGKLLVQALDGRWYYPQTAAGELRSDLPKKPNHPYEDAGDGYCYFLSGLSTAQVPRGPVKVETSFDPRTVPGQIRVESEFTP